MFIRFGCALLLVVLISLAGTALEKRNLELRRSVSRQQYRLDVLLEKHAAHRAKVEQFGAPKRLLETVGDVTAPDVPPAPDKPSTKSPPRRPKSRSSSAPKVSNFEDPADISLQ